MFDSRAEHVFFGTILETCSCFASGLPAIVRAQDCVMRDDPKGVSDALVEIKTMLDKLIPIFHKISVNPVNAQYFVDPIEWGKTVATLHSPIDPEGNTPGASGLYCPVFHVLDAFFERSAYSTALGIEALHLRSWFPANWRKLIEAVADARCSVRTYAMQLETKRRHQQQRKLEEVMEKEEERDLPPILALYLSALESYAGERGWMGTHRYKVFGFLELVFKAGRTVTNLSLIHI